MLLVNHTDDPATPGVKHEKWISLLAEERGELINVVFGYANAIGASAVAFNIGGPSASLLMNELDTTMLDVFVRNGYHATNYSSEFIRVIHVTYSYRARSSADRPFAQDRHMVLVVVDFRVQLSRSRSARKA